MGKIILKIYKYIISEIKILKYKILFLNKINIKLFSKSLILENAKIKINGKDSRIYFSNKIFMREGCILNINNGKLKIGKNVFFNSYSSVNCRQNIQIGENCQIGENVKIYDHDHIYGQGIEIKSSGFSYGDIIIGKNVWIGSNCIILKGSKIGDNCVIGAGSIVKGEIEKDLLVYQNRNLVMKKII